MRLLGFRESGRVVVSCATANGELRPLAPAEEFWADPGAWQDARAGTPSRRVDPHAVSLVPAIPPSARILCIGLNYQAHADEGDWPPPQHPTVFARWLPSLAAEGTPVAVPPGEDGLDWEGELAVVVGRPLTHATPDEAAAGVFGYAAFNDITARRAQRLTTQWTLGKNVDRSGQMSEIVTADEVGNIDGLGLLLTTTVNGETMQSARTTEMIFSVPDLLSFLSGYMTLQPGDLLATGTPSGVGYRRQPPRLLLAGDLVVVDIERVGSVSTRVV